MPLCPRGHGVRQPYAALASIIWYLKPDPRFAERPVLKVFLSVGSSMIREMKMVLLLSLGIAWLAGCKSEPAANRNLPDVAVLDVEDRTVNPFENQKAKAIVFFFVRTDCPISNRYAPEIERLAGRYGKEGVAFWLVYPDASTSAGEIERHQKEFQLSLRALRDPRHALVKRARVNVTPEAAVFLPDGREVYRGRIDDRYVDFGKERPAPTTHDLDEVLKRVMGGKPVASSVTRAVGCYIE
jgi:peroxiredoxin